MKPVLRGVLACVFSLCAAMPALASVVVTNTRVIYPESAREVTVQLANKGQQTVLVSAWLDGGDASPKPGETDIPFVITPPLFRLDPDKGQALRIARLPAALPQDHESVFWLNVHEVPPISQQEIEGKNVMQLALRTRIKLFYRPAALMERVEDAPRQLSWRLVPVSGAMVLRVENPSAYHVSFAGVALVASGKHMPLVANTVMVAPGGAHDFLLRSLQGSPAGKLQVDFEVINDFGGFSPYVVDVRS